LKQRESVPERRLIGAASTGVVPVGSGAADASGNRARDETRTGAQAAADGTPYTASLPVLVPVESRMPGRRETMRARVVAASSRRHVGFYKIGEATCMVAEQSNPELIDAESAWHER